MGSSIARPRHRSLAAFVAGRLVTMVAVVVSASVVVFVLMELAPGDAATQFLGSKGTPERVARLREELGLERPVWLRYREWATDVATGDLGRSLSSARPVGELVGEAAGRSVVLAALALLGVLVIGVGGGVWAGLRAPGRTDRVLSTVALVGLSLPEFVIGIVLVWVFALSWQVLPAVSLIPPSGLADRPQVLVLPAATLAVVAGCYVLRLVRGVVAARLDAPDVEAARLEGLGTPRLLLRHVLPPVAGPVVVATVTVLPYLVGGAVVVEQLFGYPGLGRLLVSATTERDQPVVLAILLVLSAVTVAGYALSDILARAFDPHRPGRA